MNYWVLLAALILVSCATSQNYRPRYRKAWRKVVNSQAWLDALAAYNNNLSANGGVFYAVPSVREREVLQHLEDPDMEVDQAFLERYPSMVSRAYFRIIAEAEKADSRITGAYQQLVTQAQKEENAKNRQLEKELALAEKRFVAHREMLEGLRSWRSFNRYGSDDLDFFLEEYLPEAYKMYAKGQDDDQIIAFLMVKLADLYHFEERGED